ncbi:3-hydroxyacyl-CoA dehydrogenase NAD-binding domain-containing protein [Bacteriovorax sp. PP10]|uniref:3-hydroxyacyl-CoA dehydrogenase NAD-binding domain-containing protein n=1 Tax=Bacteriovorax antarcticus TaxID=3088717 RepID=A0ABU5VYA1_9BACT|nr:3-hydroxyacyl-CoA dehydrogenase NAD-binding domain-containing protein [Bacteriovorax sp. PP10]MEA9358027.1 3-hydroxyacyl-CoA dehydrogenase NAD-binding domain-containing protein [Bacteriovorax sp. PP10]
MEIKSVVVIGTGTMGQGIAQWFLQQSLTVEMVDSNFEFAQAGQAKIYDQLDTLVTKGKLQSADVEKFKPRLQVKHLAEIDPQADLIVEAIYEDKEAKKDLFRKLDEMMKPNAIIASNTSSFPITELGKDLSDARQKRFLGLHFFNPATIMKLVEVINGLETDRSISTELITWFNQKGKVACECNDAPGFIVNRVARNFYGESLRAVETYDLEKIKEVDKVMREVGGFKMGPFELMDLIGIDVNLSVTESVYKAFFDEPRFKPHRLQKEMVDGKRYGRKTKKGFYSYE